MMSSAWRIVFLVVAVSVNAFVKSEDVNVHPLNTIKNQVWIFHHNNLTHYMTGSQATIDHKLRGRYDLIASEYGFKIQTDTASYIWIRANGTLGTTTDPSLGTILEFVPVSNEPGNKRFYIYHNWTEPLVTRESRSPFMFHLHSVYPDESPAQFSLETWVMDVDAMYGGDRNNIIKTARYIHASDFVNRPIAYEELLGLMTQHSHIVGREIFAVGQYLFQSLGKTGPFELLPSPVQMVSAAPTKLMYSRNSTANYPMKYSWATDLNDNVVEYTFTLNVDGYWSITYALDNQLRVDNGSLKDFKSTTKLYIFLLQLNSDFLSFNIFGRYTGDTGVRIEILRTFGTEPDFYFSASGQNPGENFIAVA